MEEQEFERPAGLAFFEVVNGLDAVCEKKTEEKLPHLGQKIPAAYEALGTVLSLMDGMGSCWWGCKHGDHVVEYLCGRLSSSGRAAIRLLKLGYYDESLIVIRSIGEISNLFCLFSAEPSALSDWKTLSEQQRITAFGPGPVRKRVANYDKILPINKSHYAKLCGVAAHANPDTKPQAHNFLGMPTTGGRYQEAGLAVCLNELSYAMAFATLYSVDLIDVPKDVKKAALHASLDLMKSVGGATLTAIDEWYDEAKAQFWKSQKDDVGAGEP